MLFQVNDRIAQRRHIEAVGAADAAFCHVTLLDMEGSGRSGGENISGIPVLYAAVERDQLCRLAGHVADHVFGINFSVQDALNLRLLGMDSPVISRTVV